MTTKPVGVGVDGSAESLRAAEWAAALEGWRGKYPDVSVRHDIIRGHPARVGT
jgi:nucleotide-binding universal stress UspA family protein